MDIGEKIREVFEQVKKRPILREKFSQLESMEEIYEFFHSVRGGYTKQEFYDYISDFLDELDEIRESDENNDVDEISMEELEIVSGGLGVPKKALAGALAAMSLFPSAPSGVYASEVTQNSSIIESKSEKVVPESETDKSAEEDKKEEEKKVEDSVLKEKSENGKKNKKKSKIFSKIKRFIFRNKSKIVGSIAIAVLGVIAYKYRDNLSEGFKKYFLPSNKIVIGGKEIPKDSSDPLNDISKAFYGDKEYKDLTGEEKEGLRTFYEIYNSKNDKGKGSILSKIPIVCGIVSGVSWLLGSVGGDIKYLAGLKRDISEVIAPLIPRFMSFIMEDYDPVSPVESSANMNKAFEEVDGQFKAKKQLRQAISSMVVDKYDSFIDEKPYKKGDVFYFIGPSGVGKSFMAEKLCECRAFSNDTDFYKLTTGDIDSKSKDSLVEQIFGPKYSDYYGYDSKRKTKSSLYSYIKDHPSGVVIIDEYEKLPDNSLDEIFRSIMDNGKINVVGQELDCSGITFILTSNESKDSLNLKGGRRNKKENSSITHRTHDVSFTNRLKIIEFEDLTYADYVKIARHDVYKKLKDKYAKSEIGSVDIEMSEESLSRMAKRALTFTKGARFINVDLYGEAMSSLTNLLYNDGKALKSFEGKTVELEYCPNDVTEEELENDVPDDTEGRYYAKEGDKYVRWGFKTTVKD